LFDSFPRLFAAFHALHRLLTPRHPPHALCRLTTMISGSNTTPPASCGQVRLLLGSRSRIRRSGQPCCRYHVWPIRTRWSSLVSTQYQRLPKTLSDTQENDGSFGHPPLVCRLDPFGPTALKTRTDRGRIDRVIRQGEHPRDAVSDDIEVLSRCHSKIYQIVKELPTTTSQTGLNPAPKQWRPGYRR
jgi:hypothetical protein